MRHRYLILAICCMSLLLVSMDTTIVNIALPSLRADLHASTSGLQWIIDAYTLVLASLLVLSGSTADRIGRRRVFQIGLAMFSAGSLLCSVAPNLGCLIAFRAAQAVGGSMLNPVAMSIITNTFTDKRERARAIGVWGAVVGFSMAIGPIVGGLLVDTLGWRSIFWVNVPIGLAAIALAAKFVPESKADHPRKIDPVGQVLVLLTLASITFGIIEGPTSGWLSPKIVGCFLLGVLCLVGLLTYEPRRPEPLIELRFFRSVPFSGATVIAVCAFSSLAGFLFLTALYLQEARGLSAWHAGLYTLPAAATMALVSPFSGRLLAARGPRPPLVLAGIGFTIGALLLTDITATTPFWHLMIAYLIFGAGFAMVNAPITNTAVSGMPLSQAGVAAAIASTSRQVGGTLGVAVLGAAIAGGSKNLAVATHIGWWIIVGLGLAVLALGLATTGKWARSTTERVTPTHATASA
jgi:EmrB/QacA subfamily drug resistance transporter